MTQTALTMFIFTENFIQRNMADDRAMVMQPRLQYDKPFTRTQTPSAFPTQKYLKQTTNYHICTKNSLNRFETYHKLKMQIRSFICHMQLPYSLHQQNSSGNYLSWTTKTYREARVMYSTIVLLTRKTPVPK